MGWVDVILVLTYLAVAAALLLAGWSVWRSWCGRDASARISNNIPVGRIAWGVALLLAASLLLTFVLGSATPMTINGQPFADAFWLKASDMFIYTALVLMLAAAAAVAFGMSGYGRRERK